MRTLLLLAFLVGCAGCNPNGTRRPDVGICTPLSEDREHFGCTDSRGDYQEPTLNIIGTSLDGYVVLEKYLDDLERDNKRMRRLCGQKCN